MDYEALNEILSRISEAATKHPENKAIHTLKINWKKAANGYVIEGFEASYKYLKMKGQC